MFKFVLWIILSKQAEEDVRRRGKESSGGKVEGIRESVSKVWRCKR